MSLLESNKIPLGTKMPKFELPDTNGKIYNNNLTSATETNKGTLVVFTCNHCPYALAVWPRLIKIAEYAQGLHIKTVAINSNIHPDFPEDSEDQMKVKIKELGINFPYLVDESQAVAKSFKAQCTPDIYLFNSKDELIYHGRIDDNWQDENKVTCEELKDAINNYATGIPINSDQKPSIGCSIKWK
jgi:peroxiredoxin